MNLTDMNPRELDEFAAAAHASTPGVTILDPSDPHGVEDNNPDHGLNLVDEMI